MTTGWGMAVGVYVSTYLYSVLSADAALATETPGGWWEVVAPQGSTYPLGIIRLMPQPTGQAMAGVKTLVKPEVEVFIIGQTGSFTDLVTGANRIDTLLDVSNVAYSPILIHQITSVEEIQRADTYQGQPYRSLGGRYRVWAQKG